MSECRYLFWGHIGLQYLPVINIDKALGNAILQLALTKLFTVKYNNVSLNEYILLK